MDFSLLDEEECRAYFGPLFPYVNDDEITDIDYNGEELWLTNSKNHRFLCQEVTLTKDFVDAFSKRIANAVSRPFHKMEPILEAETDKLRITIVHESVALTGRSICIRKSLPFVRMTEEEMLRCGYCSFDTLHFLQNAIKAKLNMVFCGEPGVGKTEAAKFFSQGIAPQDRVITIEDNPEWHYRAVNPGKDCIEMKVNDQVDYTKAIKTCMRLNPKWMFLSEVRSQEVLKLIEGFSTGVRGITTLHTDDVRKIPDRMVNMAGQARNESRLENDIYSFIDLGILIRKCERIDGNGRREVYRFIDQVAYFYRENGENKVALLIEDGEHTDLPIPRDLVEKMYRAGIYDVWAGDELPEEFVEENEDSVQELVQSYAEAAGQKILFDVLNGGTYRGSKQYHG